MSNLMGRLQTKLFDPKDIPSELVNCFDEVEIICGAPWERIIEKSWQHQKQSPKMAEQDVEGDPMYRGGHHNDGLPYRGQKKTIGWQPTCKCNVDKVPSIVLDPFMGAGTTLLVAKKLNRRAVGYELSEEYCQLALERNRQMGLDL